MEQQEKQKKAKPNFDDVSMNYVIRREFADKTIKELIINNLKLIK